MNSEDYVTREELDLNNRTTELESTVKVSTKYNFVAVVAMTSAVILLVTLAFLIKDSIGDIEVTLTNMDNRLTAVESDIGSMKLALARLENK